MASRGMPPTAAHVCVAASISEAAHEPRRCRFDTPCPHAAFAHPRTSQDPARCAGMRPANWRMPPTATRARVAGLFGGTRAILGRHTVGIEGVLEPRLHHHRLRNTVRRGDELLSAACRDSPRLHPHGQRHPCLTRHSCISRTSLRSKPLRRTGRGVSRQAGCRKRPPCSHGYSHSNAPSSIRR